MKGIKPKTVVRPLGVKVSGVLPRSFMYSRLLPGECNCCVMRKTYNKKRGITNQAMPLSVVVPLGLEPRTP